MEFPRTLHTARFSVALGLTGAALASCGEPAADESFVGEPLVTLTCTVSADDPSVYRDRDVRLALQWATSTEPDQRRDEDTAMVSAFPAAVVLDVVEPPTADLVLAWPDVVGRLAVGQVVLYEDVDQDGRWSDGVDFVLGTDSHGVLLFAPEGASGPGIGTLAPGFHRRVPEACGSVDGRRLNAPSDDRCEVLVSPKFAEPFAFVCPEVGPCANLWGIRQTCRADASDPICTTCAAGIFPLGATPEACDAWVEGCRAAFDASECDGELKVCRGGEEEPCDTECVCGGVYDSCIKAGLPEDVCIEKRDNCYGG